jgi:hypothetical protein
MRGTAILLLTAGLLGCKYDVDSVLLVDARRPDVRRPDVLHLSDALSRIKLGTYSGKYTLTPSSLGGDISLKLELSATGEITVNGKGGPITYSGSVDGTGLLSVTALDSSGKPDSRAWMKATIYDHDDRGIWCWKQGDWSASLAAVLSGSGKWWACYV